jgi:arylsulfatase A-like enzyme
MAPRVSSCTLELVISSRLRLSWLLIAPFVGLCLSCGGAATAPPPAPSPTPTPYAGPPNIVFILADDLGYGDLSSFGSTTIKTPNIDRIGSEGVRLTGFTVPAAICAASRAALMTGRYPVRVGIPWNPPVRLRDGELTVADLLRTRGYATAIFGKWHLGWESEDMPTHHGFDYFFGTPSGDERQFWLGDQPTSDGTSEELLTQVYTQDGIKWMQSVKDRPFFLYMAYHAPHEPLAASAAFLGKSAGGLYGDVIQELDWGVGQIQQAISDLGLDQKTLVVFASDNGPTRARGETGGSSGPFSGGKGSCLEGGLRVPALARWPVHIPAGRTITDNTSTLDLLPTFLAMAGGTLPADRVYSGLDLTGLLTGTQSVLPGPGVTGGRELIHYFSTAPSAIRTGKWKYLAPGFWGTSPALYDLDADPAESVDLGPSQPDLEAKLKQRLQDLADQVATSR